MSEHEFQKDGERHLLVSGREFLADIKAGYTGGPDLSIGERLAAIPISPEAIGGRLFLMSHAFEQHRIRHLRICYCPSVAATVPGSIFIYFRNDIGTDTLTTGRPEIAHASTAQSFVQTQVWEPASIDIDPVDALSTYFDESNNALLTTQGLVQLETASTLRAGEYGSLFIDYEFEFFSPTLDYEIEDVYTATMTIATAGTNSVTAFESITFLDTPAAGYAGSWTLTTSFVPTQDYIFYGVISRVGATINGLQLVPWYSQGAEAIWNFAVGQLLWCRFISQADGIRVTMYSTLAGVMNASSASELNNEDADNIVSNLTVLSLGTTADALLLDGRFWKIGGK
jgi:hypothetical protein